MKAISLKGFYECPPEDHRNWLDFLDLLSETQLESLSLNDLLPNSLDGAQRPLKTVKTLLLTTDVRLIKHGVSDSPIPTQTSRFADDLPSNSQIGPIFSPSSNYSPISSIYISEEVGSIDTSKLTTKVIFNPTNFSGTTTINFQVPSTTWLSLESSTLELDTRTSTAYSTT